MAKHHHLLADCFYLFSTRKIVKYFFLRPFKWHTCQYNKSIERVFRKIQKSVEQIYSVQKILSWFLICLRPNLPNKQTGLKRKAHRLKSADIGKYEGPFGTIFHIRMHFFAAQGGFKFSSEEREKYAIIYNLFYKFL